MEVWIHNNTLACTHDHNSLTVLTLYASFFFLPPPVLPRTLKDRQTLRHGRSSKCGTSMRNPPVSYVPVLAHYLHDQRGKICLFFPSFFLLFTGGWLYHVITTSSLIIGFYRHHPPAVARLLVERSLGASQFAVARSWLSSRTRATSIFKHCHECVADARYEWERPTQL